jgi:hypothetical protein
MPSLREDEPLDKHDRASAATVVDMSRGPKGAKRLSRLFRSCSATAPRPKRAMTHSRPLAASRRIGLGMRSRSRSAKRSLGSHNQTHDVRIPAYAGMLKLLNRPCSVNCSAPNA